MTKNFSQTAAFIWSVADLLRGDFKQSQYGRIILPFTLLRRLECVLAETKANVVAESQRIAEMGWPEEAQEKLLIRASKRPFYNISPMDLSKMGQSDIKDNLNTYVQSFSKDAREIFEHFKFEEFVGQLADANLLYKVVQKFANTDLSPEAISNHEMGFVFEELIRRFAESSNETAGEHFTPRDIVRLTTSLVFMEDDSVLSKEGIIRTIYDPTAGVVGKINRKEGDGSKSEKLADALVNSQPIIIVTIQTFPFVLKAIEDSSVLKSRRYAIIADEAHSSQTGSTARQLKEVLVSGDIESNTDDDAPLSSEDVLDATLAARRSSPNLSYYAFTATPKPKTIELFGRLPNPDLPAAKDNLPAAYHVYSMRQAIEEGFILDVLKNYTNYKVVYQLKQKLAAEDDEVDARRAKIKLNNWVRLHEHNIAQKVKIIIEHFNDNIKGLLGGQAKAMVVTGSRKEAVRYKIAFDNYIADYGYRNINAMVAFSGEVTFNDNDPDSGALLDHKFTEHNMNIGLKGRDLRDAFDSDDYQVMLVANKFQTGFDQPKLCAMYVDKKLTGVDCVQTLSRLNRTYKGKAESGTFVLDFFNDPQDILDAFQPYYETATLADVSDPDQVYDLYEKLRASGIFLWNEVEQFVEAFYSKNKSNAAISNICKPAVERWQKQYYEARTQAQHAKTMLERTKATGDVVLMTNAQNDYKGFKTKQDELEIFKKDLGTFTRQYEFMSQIVDYDSKELEMLSLYARNLQPLLRESVDNEDDVDLSNIVMSHYRVSKLYQQDLKLEESKSEYQLDAGGGAGTAKPKDKKEAFLSQVIERLNEVFDTENLSDSDLINYAQTVRDKMSENQIVMVQIFNNTPDQAMLGDFPAAMDNAVMESSEAHQEQMIQLLSDPAKFRQFSKVVFNMLLSA